LSASQDETPEYVSDTRPVFGIVKLTLEPGMSTGSSPEETGPNDAVLAAVAATGASGFAT
jgi:hypothetical protein